MAKANLEYYKIFYYVAKEGSISLAAKRVCISQPAVSQAIKQLESVLNCQLFIRVPKGMRLTKEGEVLYQCVREGYELILKGEERLDRMLNLESGEIRIGASDMTLQYYLLPYLEEFHIQYPKIKVTVTNGPTPETLALLKDGQIDFGIVSEPFSLSEDYSVIRVKEIIDIFVAGKRFDYLRNQTMDYEELAGLPVICLENDTSTRRYVDEYLSSHGVVLSPEFELATSDMIVQFAKRSLGIGLVVEDFATELIKQGELFEVKLKTDIPSRHFCVVENQRFAHSTASRKLLALLKESQYNKI
ncbi:MAG TPA: LysR family transcriptional regulator [Lachnoclostridium phytofermentans]|uniref:LysR family transcriptional regulator n=1 Tax=Lachnoclostridium phytofermentans TaxID=66219 RepID=A0A3D2X694_9FIRM|nr:LysR family transcriptional regulator [Lachnoclostridium sp.]HCL02661.1 LysR family transcriptional regulator [Lachnoclostridium phytofermentans]